MVSIKRKQNKPHANLVRLSIPFTMACLNCNEYVVKNRKYFSRKEIIDDETYLGVEIYRFYITCVQCNSEMTFKTDPKDGDYKPEFGCRKIEKKVNTTKQKEEDPEGIEAIEQRAYKLKELHKKIEEIDNMKTCIRSINTINDISKSYRKAISEEYIKKKNELLKKRG
ncbi:YJU2 splicing factor like protein [Astathelohania contejeani]|uniref:YJU2 splicing factor like protein n=1 Tax=Astathelohania contejeani TaxID=164912 RepID=A0ABQ7HY53_9MICR|nr:YJU2 splicing factor like protein [Thelohania contejeani]